MKHGYAGWVTLLLAGLTLTFVGCGGGGTGEKASTVKVAITGQALAGVASVVLAISEVRVVPAGQETQPTASLPRIVRFSPPHFVDLRQQQFRQQVLGEASPPDGDYTQVRLVLAPNVAGQDPVNYVIYAAASDERVALQSPSGQQSGLQVPGRFSIQTGQASALVLDFDPAQAIVSVGSRLNLKPTGIRVTQAPVVLRAFGALSGVLTPAAARSTAWVSVIPQGQTRALATGTVNPETGAFRAMLPRGTYYVRAAALGSSEYDGSLMVPPQLFTVAVGRDRTAGEVQLFGYY